MNEAKASAVVAAIETGDSLRKAAADNGVAPSTFLRWCDENKELAEQYARARRIGDEVGFLELDVIADEPPEKDQFGKVDPGWVAWQRMRIDTRKWSLSKKHPTKYGDKTHIEHSGKLGLESLIAGEQPPADE